MHTDTVHAQTDRQTDSKHCIIPVVGIKKNYPDLIPAKPNVKKTC